MPENTPEAKPRVALLVTCLVDLFRPSVGFAAIRLLEGAGCEVSVPAVQTCCGQPAYNNGDGATARAIAAQVIDAFAGFDYVVAPSGSCAGMVAVHYPELFGDDPEMAARARELAARTHELTAFLADIMGVDEVPGHCPGIAAYHDSCAGLRELGIKSQPRKLLAMVGGLELREYAEATQCCGFGGTFAIKFSEISDAMVSGRVAALAANGAALLLGGDLGCLMTLAGKLARQGSPIQVRHVAEVLAGMTAAPPISAPKRGTPK